MAFFWIQYVKITFRYLRSAVGKKRGSFPPKSVG